MFDFPGCECGKAHRTLACMNVARFTVKGDPGWWSHGGIIAHLHSAFSSREAAWAGWRGGGGGDAEDQKNMFGSRSVSSCQAGLTRCRFGKKGEAGFRTSECDPSLLHPQALHWMRHSAGEIGNWPVSVSEGKWQLSPLDSFAPEGSSTSDTLLYPSLALLFLQVSVEIFPGSWGSPPTTLGFLPRYHSVVRVCFMPRELLQNRTWSPTWLYSWNSAPAQHRGGGLTNSYVSLKQGGR